MWRQEFSVADFSISQWGLSSNRMCLSTTNRERENWWTAGEGETWTILDDTTQDSMCLPFDVDQDDVAQFPSVDRTADNSILYKMAA